MHKSDFDDSDRAKALRRVTALGQIETISQISPTSQRSKVVKATPVAATTPRPIAPMPPATKITSAPKPTPAPKSASTPAKSVENHSQPKRRLPGPAEFGRQVKRQEPHPETSPRIIQHFADRRPAAHLAPKVTLSPPTPITPFSTTNTAPTPSPAVSDAKPNSDTASDITDSTLDAALDAAFNATLNPPTELQSSSANDSQSVPTKLPKTLPRFSFKAFKSFKSHLVKFQDSQGKALKAQLSKFQDNQGKAFKAQLSKLQDSKDKTVQLIKAYQPKSSKTPKKAKAPSPKTVKNLGATKALNASKVHQKSARHSKKPNIKKINIKNLDVDTTSTIAQRVVLSIIGILVLIVCGGIIVLLNYNTKAQLETKITGLAKTYYEDYFYPNIFSGNISIADVLAEFGESGLTEVTLRQLILTNPNLSSSEIHFLREHCNQETTTVRYYPVDPYDRTSYRTEFNYSCNFDDDLISV